MTHVHQAKNPGKAYLDTSAAIAFSRMLSEIASECYTSALTVFELISSIDDSKFIKRRGVIDSIFSSGIEVDWRMPREIICSAFPNIELGVEREGAIVNEVGIKICAASSFEALHSILKVRDSLSSQSERLTTD